MQRIAEEVRLRRLQNALAHGNGPWPPVVERRFPRREDVLSVTATIRYRYLYSALQRSADFLNREMGTIVVGAALKLTLDLIKSFQINVIDVIGDFIKVAAISLSRVDQWQGRQPASSDRVMR